MTREDEVAQALDGIASALRALGTADASTHLGAIEFLGMEIRAGSQEIASAILDLAAAVRESRQ